MIRVFHQRLSISAKDSVEASDKFPVHSKKDDICQTNTHVHYHESLAANLVSPQKASRSLPNVIQREEMLRRTNHGQQPFPPDLVIEDLMSRTLEIVVLGQPHLVRLQHWSDVCAVFVLLLLQG